MKKHLLIIPAIAVAVSLAGCSVSSQSESSNKETKAAAVTGSKDLKKPLVIFFTDLARTINEKDAALNAYESNDKPTQEMKTQASQSAADVAEQLEKFQIPEDLKGEKAQLEAALKDFANSYSAKAEELKKDSPSLEQANMIFTQGADKLGAVYIENKLLRPDLNKEVN